MAFGNKDRTAIALTSMRRGYVRHVEDVLPQLDASLDALLRQAGVAAREPIVVVDGHLSDCLPARWVRQPKDDTIGRTAVARAWLPISPLVILLALPPERIFLYLDRFKDGSHRSGWLVCPRDRSHCQVDWLFDYVDRNYRAGRTYANGSWSLTWFEWLPQHGQPAAASREPAAAWTPGKNLAHAAH